ncbi:MULTISPECIES: Hsp20/alpha crystallin family protein [Trichocoleus]|uniref:Hsp20/alpha crystallin family protein n=1 Tax=Trichocoleus desertorum GB2-A4 TaxID=2933944 RepID=A0ABV0J9U0_9CYAN|nr:Hsp20/alpha crystallin family protein [Trichocoleus sp. FACHB-46]MBD1861039.1 Hsp20/alpha crystallin family protein [Trichocoleus sp. FACHB-46]
MTLVRWEPFREVNSLQREMNRLFDRLANGDEGDLTNTRTPFIPAAEIYETGDAIQLKVEVPGLEAQDLDVQVSAEAVSIQGERKSETKTEEKGMIRSEFRYGQFQRVIPLPNRVKNEQVEAEFKNGVLTLTLPKVDGEKNKVVKINLG